MTKDEALDKKADNAMIYKTFEQWMNGDFLEVGEPRKKAYSEDELLLVEMGWNYGYDAGRAVEQALDKMAENARELGLDYEPVQQEPVAWLKVIETPGGWGKFVEAKPHEKGAKPVYTSPQPAQRTWVGLTDEDIDELFEYGLAFERPRVIYREIEAKLKEKNNG